MVRLDESALICDLAETYHVLDWRALPARTAAALAMGLGPDSRIMRRISGTKLPLSTTLQAMSLDMLRLLVWQNSKDARKGRNRPASVLEQLLGAGKKDPEPGAGFASVSEFKAWRASMIGGGKNG